MYTLCLIKDFIARHYLIGGDWGAENSLHEHHYKIELRLSSESLDRHGYLVDLVDVEMHLETIIAGYREKTLNELAPFKGKNPSLELFARILWMDFQKRLGSDYPVEIEIRLWENDFAWAQWSQSHR